MNIMSKLRTNSGNVVLAVLAIIALIVVALTLFSVRVYTVKGNELGVLETWSGGVTGILPPKTYVYPLGFANTVYHYDASEQILVMNDQTPDQGEVNPGRQHDSYAVQSSDQQTMHISMNCRYRIDPLTLTNLHSQVRSSGSVSAQDIAHDIAEKIVRPAMMLAVKDRATVMTAAQAYSGTNLVLLQQQILQDLSNPNGSLCKSGVIFDNFVIESIVLDPDYVKEITTRQTATLRQSRLAAEKIAADQAAEVARSTALADYNVQLVQAQLRATNQVIAAQADNERAVIAAKAEQQKRTLEAEGESAAMKSIAEGNLAVAQAEAKGKQLLFAAWETPGAQTYAKIQIASSTAQAFSGIKGYLPSDMKVNLMTGNFLQAIDALVGAPAALPAAK